MMLIPSAVWTFFTSWRIWSCTMTSRAVVGSSAMITWGSHESAIAMTAAAAYPPRTRAGNDPPSPVQADQVEQLADPVPDLFFGQFAPKWVSIASRICS